LVKKQNQNNRERGGEMLTKRITGDKTENKTNRMCSICFLIESTNKNTKFHLYDEDFFPNEQKFVCEHCVSWIHDIRRRASEQAENPENNSFKDVTWWWNPKQIGMSAVDEKIKD
jgi:hypothetical protein